MKEGPKEMVRSFISFENRVYSYCVVEIKCRPCHSNLKKNMQFWGPVTPSASFATAAVAVVIGRCAGRVVAAGEPV